MTTQPPTDPSDPHKGTIELKKTVIGDWNYDKTQFFYFQVTFSHPTATLTGADGILFNGLIISNPSFEVNVRPGQTTKFTNIPLGTTYTITEIVTRMPTPPTGSFRYVGITSNNTGTINSTDKVTVEATNEFTSYTKGTVIINKTLESGHIPADKVFTVRLWQGGEVRYTYTLNSGNGWSVTKSIVPATYTIEEINVPSGWTLLSTNPQTVTVNVTGGVATIGGGGPRSALGLVAQRNDLD